MSNIAIKAENVSKAYQLGEFSTGTLTRDIQRRIALLRGKEDPYLKVGETNDRTSKGESDIVWSLKDINFEINQGDAVGIIGRNGAGKSTLLKVLSRVTTPTTGIIKVKGRIASLLEVGTGFHPELTGRENIFLNGAILGMRKHEIKQHFDAIVDFAGVERYIDTPVKRYSSGMYVRLAFAVAAHLESEILIVDEVLAVGDAEFQKKCLGKMNDVSKGEGRTVLFVSHNMSSVAQLCNHGILMKNGSIEYNGGMNYIIEKYLNSNTKNVPVYDAEDDKEKLTQILHAFVSNDDGTYAYEYKHNENINITFRIKHFSEEKGVRCNLAVWDMMDRLIFIERIDIAPNIGYLSVKAQIPNDILVPNQLKISLALDIPSVRLVEMMPEYLYFEIVDVGVDVSKNGDSENGVILSKLKLSIIE